MKTKAKIEEQLKKKTNPEIVETIILAKKSPKWNEVASILTNSSNKRMVKNLEEIEREVKEGDKIIVPGKILSSGNLSKKIKIVALSFSEKSIKKLDQMKLEYSTILEEMEKNKEAKELRILK